MGISSAKYHTHLFVSVAPFGPLLLAQFDDRNPADQYFTMANIASSMNNLLNRAKRVVDGHNRILTDSLQHHSSRSILEVNRLRSQSHE